jgi:hypothetical protein
MGGPSATTSGTGCSAHGGGSIPFACAAVGERVRDAARS